MLHSPSLDIMILIHFSHKREIIQIVPSLLATEKVKQKPYLHILGLGIHKMTPGGFSVTFGTDDAFACMFLWDLKAKLAELKRTNTENLIFVNLHTPVSLSSSTENRRAIKVGQIRFYMSQTPISTIAE